MKITRADGTVEKQRALTEKELRRVLARSKRSPRTWDEINSTKGGGRDFGQQS